MHPVANAASRPAARRVVVTGMGIVSCIGNDADAVSASLRGLRPGIRFIT